jgi:hypothetical protein
MAQTAVEAKIHDFPVHRRDGAVESRSRLGAATWLSFVVAGLMALISVLGLAVDGLYHDGPWAAEAFRGADLITLVVAAPLLVAATVLARRGSARATAVWLGMIGYAIYNYAFYVFGPNFNDAFLLHILVFTLAIYAFGIGLSKLGVRAVGERLRNDRWARWLGGLLVAVGLGQGGLWVFLALRYVATGELLNDIPVGGQHLVFALDLALMMPALVISGVLLFRRRAVGYLFATAASVLGAVYTLNGLAAAWFQSNADVPGTKAFSPDAIVLTVTMAVPALVLVLGGRSSEA